VPAATVAAQAAMRPFTIPPSSIGQLGAAA